MQKPAFNDVLAMTDSNTQAFDQSVKVAVTGAGISGLIAARTLVERGLQVTVFEKSRGVGGRMATRRGEGKISFDHGAQYFTVRDERFREYVESWIEQGIVAAWPSEEHGQQQKIVSLKNGCIESKSKSIRRFVGVPGMNSICKHLAIGLEIQKQTRVGGIESSDSSIDLLDHRKESLGSFDRVIVSAPVGQTAELLINFPVISEPISGIRMNPCWAAMASFEKPITSDWVGALLQDSFLSWAARNSTKPGRSSEREQLVIHANPDWTLQHWDQEPENVANEMLEEFWSVSGISPQTAVHLQGHRWKYAIPVEPSEERCFFDVDNGIAACGDWASGSRVEGAFLSGLAASEKILGTLTLNADARGLQKPQPFGRS